MKIKKVIPQSAEVGLRNGEAPVRNVSAFEQLLNLFFDPLLISGFESKVEVPDPARSIDEERLGEQVDPIFLPADVVITFPIFEKRERELVFLDELPGTRGIASGFDGDHGEPLIPIILPERLEAWQLHAARGSRGKPEAEKRDLSLPKRGKCKIL